MLVGILQFAMAIRKIRTLMTKITTREADSYLRKAKPIARDRVVSLTLFHPLPCILDVFLPRSYPPCSRFFSILTREKSRGHYFQDIRHRYLAKF